MLLFFKSFLIRLLIIFIRLGGDKIAMKKDDFVRINFEGKIKETGKVFDSGKSVGIVVGGGYVLPGLDESLLQMNVGEKKNMDVEPKKAFGERDQSLVHTVPEAEFKKHGTTPTPGMTIEADNRRGRVMSVSSGRVKIDFNHPLAGKVLNYNVEIIEKIEKPEEKIKAIVTYFTKFEGTKIEVTLNGKEVELIVPPLIHPAYKKRISDEIMKFMDVEKVKFSEIFEKKTPKK